MSTLAKQDDIEADIELDEYLTKIYEQNVDKINKISRIIQYSSFFGIISLLVFLILVAIRTSNSSLTFSFFFILIPALSSVTFFTVFFNSYLMLKDIFDEAEKKKDDDSNGLQIGSMLSYFCLNAVAISVIIYLVVFCLKIDNYLIIQWNVISVPLFIILGIGVFYFVFILPAFIQNNLIFDLILIFCYLITSFMFTICLNFKLDGILAYEYTYIFIPIILSLFLHIVFSVISFIKENDSNSEKLNDKMCEKNDIYSKICFITAMIFTLTAFILIPLKLDAMINIHNWIPTGMIVIAYMFVVNEKIYSFFVEEKDDEKTTLSDT